MVRGERDEISQISPEIMTKKVRIGIAGRSVRRTPKFGSTLEMPFLIKILLNPKRIAVSIAKTTGKNSVILLPLPVSRIV